MTRNVCSKLFYLGGTALLSSIISMTGAKADNVSSVTVDERVVAGFPFGVVLQLPSGVYYAAYMPNGSFIVSQGTDPVTSGVHSVFSTAPAGPGLSPSLLSSLSVGAFSTTTGNNGTPLATLGTVNASLFSTTMSLADNGALTINTVNTKGGPSTQDYSNNVNDPVVGYDVTGVTYDVAHPTISASTQVTGLEDTMANKTPINQVFSAQLSLAHTDSSSHMFSLSEAVQLASKATFDAKIPLIGEGKAEITLSTTTTAGRVDGETVSNTQTFNAGANVTVPAHSVYQAVIIGAQDTFSVPFTYTGDATYKDGAVVPVDGSGTFETTETGVFQTAIICVSQPGGCDSGISAPEAGLPDGFLAPGETLVGLFPATPLPVPEPSTWAMMLLGFGGLGFLGYRKGGTAIA
jgi:PEP-CTERM motif